MKSGIDKREIDEKLAEGFQVIDELGKEYRSYFSIIEPLLSSHEGNLISAFHTWEMNILNIFAIFNNDKLDEIQKKRLMEAEYLSYVKEEILAQDAAKEQPQLDAKGKPIVKKKEPPKQLKKGEVMPLTIPQKPIENFKSPIGFDYIVDITYVEIASYIIRDICEHKELSEENIISNIVNFKSPIPTRPDSKIKELPKDKKVAKEEVKEEIPDIDTLIVNSPYKVLPKKEFISPISIKMTKVLSVRISH